MDSPLFPAASLDNYFEKSLDVMDSLAETRKEDNTLLNLDWAQLDIASAHERTVLEEEAVHLGQDGLPPADHDGLLSTAQLEPQADEDPQQQQHNEEEQEEEEEEEEEDEEEDEPDEAVDAPAPLAAAPAGTREGLYEAAAGWPALTAQKVTREDNTRRQLLIGTVPGVACGAAFVNRAAVRAAGVHRPPMAGIFGDEQLGAESVVLNGGYEDDSDLGTEVFYTGAGGQDGGTHVHDQQLQGVNLAIARSAQLNRPVRVVRGFKLPSPYAPPEGYRYDGLYKVASYWLEKTHTGFRVVRYRLLRIPGQPPLPPPRTGYAKKASPYKVC